MQCVSARGRGASLRLLYNCISFVTYSADEESQCVQEGRQLAVAACECGQEIDHQAIMEQCQQVHLQNERQ